MTPLIRPAAKSDMTAIQAIYAREVLHGTASFELESPDVDEICRRWETVAALGLPYLVAEDDDMLLGYAYASLYRPRPAYRFTVESSIYLHENAQGRGLGVPLMEAVISACTAQNYRQMVAVIGNSGHRASIRLHEKLGFEPAGLFRNVGWKHGQWLDSVLMQRALGDGAASAPE